MKIILLGHPSFFGSHSMDRFAAMIVEGMRARGHQAELWRPAAVMCRLPAREGLSKWLGYIDQYILFPMVALWRLRRVDKDVLLVLADHALGIWMPLLRNRPHVVHCHDFIALRTLAGEFPEHGLSRSGRTYQQLIRWGLTQAKAFVTVSNKTMRDLRRLHPCPPEAAWVVYNGMNYPFRRVGTTQALACLQRAGVAADAQGMLVHIGGNQWYKNREGVLALYLAYCRKCRTSPLALWMIGGDPTAEMRAEAARAAGLGGSVRFLTGLPTEAVQAAYSLAAVMLFPSLEEGFGWPIIEAMACGAPVLTTNRAPMTEIGGGLVQLVEPLAEGDMEGWAQRAAHVLAGMLAWPAQRRAEIAARSIAWAKLFSADKALDQYESIYQGVLAAVSVEGRESVDA
ncbi:glycosyltransferase [Cupriavidus sp. 2TAF22]|uniref:glycosyltransferase n=1 Tax=unclassified Cupriavidus TaxID=2640874 RepID=UPI003F8F199A